MDCDEWELYVLSRIGLKTFIVSQKIKAKIRKIIGKQVIKVKYIKWIIWICTHAHQIYLFSIYLAGSM